MTHKHEHLGDTALQELAFGEEESAVDAMAHVSSCATCAEALESYRGLGGALAGLADPSVDETIVASVMAEVREQAAQSRSVADRSAADDEVVVVPHWVGAAGAGILALVLAWLGMSSDGLASIAGRSALILSELVQSGLFLRSVASALPTLTVSVVLLQALGLLIILLFFQRVIRGGAALPDRRPSY